MGALVGWAFSLSSAVGGAGFSRPLCEIKCRRRNRLVPHRFQGVMHFRCEVETAQTGDQVAWSGSKPLRSLKGLPHDSNGISTMVCLQNLCGIERNRLRHHASPVFPMVG
jgi:hypothetical protein